jgi:hypothetical protein
LPLESPIRSSREYFWPQISPAGVASIQQIQNLPGPASDAIREVFRTGVRWAFLSLVPWVAIGSIISAFLSSIVNLTLRRRNPKSTSQTKHTSSASEISGDQEYQKLGPEPRYNGRTLAGRVIFKIKKRKWEKRKAEIDQR